MPAGRPPTVDQKRLYRLACHFYSEFKQIQGEADKSQGPWRIYVDEKALARLEHQAEISSRLSTEEVAHLGEGVDRQIQLGYIPAEEREHHLQQRKDDIEFHRRFAGHNAAMDEARHAVFIPPEPEIIDKLLKADSPNRIKRFCAEAFLPPREDVDEYGNVLLIPQAGWPISGESLLPKCLTEHAAQFIEARKDARFPKSNRPSSRLKQLWFLSRALAGAVQGIATRTAINEIGAVRPDEPAMLSRITKRTRNATKNGRKRT